MSNKVDLQYSDETKTSAILTINNGEEQPMRVKISDTESTRSIMAYLFGLQVQKVEDPVSIKIGTKTFVFPHNIWREISDCLSAFVFINDLKEEISF